MVWVLGAALAAGVTGELKLAAAALFLLVWRTRGRRLPARAAVFLLVLSAAYGVYGYLSIAGIRKDLARVRSVAERSGRANLEGWVCSFPVYRYGGMAFDFRTRLEGVSCVVRVRTREFAVCYGDSLRLTGSWKTAKPSDQKRFERGLMAQGVCGDFRAVPGGVSRRKGVAGGWVTREVLSPCHRRLREELSRGLGAKAGFPIAVLLGETGYLDRRLADAYRELGITHLIALSGQHLCFIAGAVLVVLRLFGRRSTAVLLTAITAYVWVVGFIVSLWRSFVMAMLLALAGAVKRPLDPVKALAEAFVIVVLCYPNTFYSIGFQLSFLATLALLLSIRSLRPPSSRSWVSRLKFSIRSSLYVSVAAQLVVTPLLIRYFDRVSVFAPAATLVFMLPVAFVLLASGFSAAASALVAPAGAVLYVVLDRAVGVLDRAVIASADLVPGTISPPAPEPYIYYAGLGLLAFARGRRAAKIAGWTILAASFVAGILRREVF